MGIKVKGTGVQMASGRGIGSAAVIFWGVCPVLAVWNSRREGGWPSEQTAASHHLVTRQSLKPPDLGTEAIWSSQASTLLTLIFNFKVP